MLGNSENDLIKNLVSCITSYGKGGVPLSCIEDEFEMMCGFEIPFRENGFKNIKSYLMSLPDIYVLKNEFNNEVVITQSSKQKHLKQLINNQTNNKRKYYSHFNNSYEHGGNKKRKYWENFEFKKTHVHYSISNMNSSSSFEEFNKLEEMLPLLYNHQALGDDFFVDLADKKLAYQVLDDSCGLCQVGMTISELTEKVKNTQRLAPRVVVLIGLNDLILGNTINSMMYNLRTLIMELKKRNTRVTLVTLFENPKLRMTPRMRSNMQLFNKAIMEYAKESYLQCNVIDMNQIFIKEKEQFKRDLDRFQRFSKKDKFQVFSDYGRKVFLNAIKACLKAQIQQGH